jgi:hypothetical protein
MKLKDSLVGLAGLVRKALNGVAANRHSESKFYKLVLGASGATVRVEHNLGRQPFYQVVYFESSTAAGPDIKATTGTDNSVLALASYVAGTAWIEVF